MFGPGVESPAADAPVEVPPRSPARALKQQWARLITQVYKADPLLYPQFSSAMRIIAFIEQPEVIEKVLTHLGLWPSQVPLRNASQHNRTVMPGRPSLL